MVWFDTFSFLLCFACRFSTSQLPKVVRAWCVLYIFNYFQMCFAPQRRALFPYLNFQKSSENGLLCYCLLPNVLCATTACTFSTSQLAKEAADPGVLILFPSPKCFALASLLFDPPEPQNAGKITVFRDFPTLSRTCIFSLLTFSMSELLPSWPAF